jgi:hypothetical protein
LDRDRFRQDRVLPVPDRRPLPRDPGEPPGGSREHAATLEEHCSVADGTRGRGTHSSQLGLVGQGRILVSRLRNSLTTKAVAAPGWQGATTTMYPGDTSRRSNEASRDAAAADWQAISETGH